MLVLDADLASISSLKQSRLELLLRILCNTEMRHLWTLQEASVMQENESTDKLHFQFSEELRNPKMSLFAWRVFDVSSITRLKGTTARMAEFYLLMEKFPKLIMGISVGKEQRYCIT